MAKVLEIKKMVAETGIMLLEQKLAARTWGNTSARIDDAFFAISPSGLDYLHTEPEDIAVVRLADMTWKGRRKPSSEKGIHAAAYNSLADVRFVIHTHQKFATALGLGGFDSSRLTPEEKEILGTVTTAAYGLPGTKTLAANVAKRFEEGSRVVFMKHHGVVICGTDRDDAFRKAVLLEEVCRKQIRGMDPGRPAGEQFAKLGIPMKAQLDDMAQMLGGKIRVVSQEAYSKDKLRKYGALIIKDKGIKVYADDPEDREALLILTEKAAVSALHTRAIGEKALIPAADTWLMRTVYKFKYSKQKKG